MPVYVERITHPSAQDQADLQKIYLDAPDWLLAPHADGASLIAAGIASGQLIAGRFNDRLLGAALLQSGEPWRLSHLCVRKVTRQRGVARRLLDEAQRLSQEAGSRLHLAAPPGHAQLEQLAARRHLPLDPL